MSFDILSTHTSEEQQNLEHKLLKLYTSYADSTPAERAETLALRRKEHVEYLQSGLGTLPSAFVSLDASRPWLCYWIVHSLALLKAPLRADVSTSDVVAFLRRCQHTEGGFGGGPGQLPHLAPTYAAVATAITIGGDEALLSIKRDQMAAFLELRCRAPSDGGGFQVCEGGEVDVRGCYTAMATAHMLGLDAQGLARKAAMMDYVQRCQTYEGGIGGEPGNEAHGGYTFCGLAALMLVDAAHVLDLPRLLNWATRCQGTMEGGFMGRTNKLVDGCYSFWQGGLFPLLQRLGPQYLAQTGVPRNPPWSLGTSPTSRHTDEPGASTRNSSAEAPNARRPAEALEGQASVFEGEGRQQGCVSPSGSRASHREATQRRRLMIVPSFPVGRPCGVQKQAASAVAVSQELADDAIQRAIAKETSLRKAPTEGDLRRRQQDMQAANLAAADAQRAVQRALDREEITQVCAAVLCGAEADTASAAMPIFEEEGEQQASVGAHDGPDSAQKQEQTLPLYNSQALKLWVQLCCQAGKGGLRDKPGKPPDYYHSCYCLSGFSSAQHSCRSYDREDELLAEADPLCNVVAARLSEARSFFAAR